MLKTLKNAWRIPELKKKLLFTLLIIVIYRLGANIPVPYVDASQVENAANMFNGSVLQLFNTLSGNALAQATLFALGVSPYITASIVMQLLTIAIPPLERLSKDGENGRKKITAITRIVTIALAIVESIGYLFMIEGYGYLITRMNDAGEIVPINFFQKVIIVACYCAGAALVMWLAEKINDHGIGNGISMILFANIVAGAAGLFQQLYGFIFPGEALSSFDWVGLLLVIGVILMFLGMIVLIVWMSDAERRIPIQYAKRVVGRKMYGGQNTNLPIKVNMSGVMPIIFANAIVTLPATIARFFGESTKAFPVYLNKIITADWPFTGEKDAFGQPIRFVHKLLSSLVRFDHWGWIYLIIFLVLLIAFAFFYVAISFNPVEVANNIKGNGDAIPGIRSGKPTIEYIKKVLNRITMVGALIVAFIACFPLFVNIIGWYCGTQAFSVLAFTGSSIMIVVGVALETVRDLEAQMSLRNYKGFLD